MAEDPQSLDRAFLAWLEARLDDDERGDDQALSYLVGLALAGARLDVRRRPARAG